jgi:predicted DNA-binding protein with PD1-like motif
VIGGFSSATLGYFEWTAKRYKQIPVNEQVEVLTLAGDIALDNGEPKVHAHVILGRADASTLGGHLIEAHVRPTLEVVLEESPVHLRRRMDSGSGLALIDL